MVQVHGSNGADGSRYVQNTKIQPENLTADEKLREWGYGAADARYDEPEPKDFDVQAKLAEVKRQKHNAVLAKRSEVTGKPTGEYIKDEETKLLHNPRVQSFLKDFQKQLGIDCDFKFQQVNKIYDGNRHFIGQCEDSEGNKLPYSCHITMTSTGEIKIEYTHIKQGENEEDFKTETLGSVTLTKQENADETSYVMTATDAEGVAHSDIVDDVESDVISPYAKVEEQVAQHVKNFKDSLGITGEFRVTSVGINQDDGSETRYATSEDGQYALTINIKADGSQSLKYEKIGEGDTRTKLGTFEVKPSENDKDTTLITGTYADGTKYDDKIVDQKRIIS